MVCQPSETPAARQGKASSVLLVCPPMQSKYMTTPAPIRQLSAAHLRSATLSIAGVAIHYVQGMVPSDTAAAPHKRALLLHGWGGSIASWEPVTEALLAQGFEVLVVDFPGFGSSPPPPVAWGVEDYTHHLIGLLDELGFAPANVIAHSFGGRVAIMLAATRPDLVRRLVLVAAAGIRTATPSLLRQTATRVGKAIFSLPGLTGIGEQIRKRVASSDYLEAGALRATFVKVVEQDLRDFAARITRPTLLIWGDQDTETPLAQAHILESLIADSGLVILYGAGHFCYLEQFPRFARILNQFLKD